MLGYNAEDGFESDHRRIIIPFFRNGQPVYYAGRDLTSRYKQKDPDGKEYGQKYKYCANDDGIEKIVWGLQTLRKPITEHSRKALIADLEGSVAEEYLRDDTLVICEGLLDAAILQQDGWQVLCSGGGAFGRYNIPLVVDIMRMYPQVVLAFDNDKAGKSFASRYGELCIDEHIKFTVAQIPERYGEHSKIKDINDYYLAGAPISELIKQATPGLVYLAQSLKSIDAIHDFVNKCAPFASEYDLQQVKEMLAAKRVDPVTDENGEHIPGMPAVEPMFKSKQLNYAFEEAMKKTPDLVIIERVKRNHNILYASDSKFYEFTGRAWVRITQQTVVRYVAEAIGPSARSGRCQAIMNFMKAIEESTVPFDTQNIFTFKNGVFLLDKATVPQKDPGVCFVPHNPDFMNTTYVDYEINPYQRWLLGWADHTPAQFKPMQSSADDGHYHAPTEADSSRQITIDTELKAADDTPDKSRKPLAPLWQECCRKWFVDENGNYDPKLERQAQLMAGYCFFPDNRLQKCFMLVGKGSNGKSTFLEVIKELFGRHNCSYLRPDRLTNPFDVMQIRHSMINICHESARSMGGAEEILKAVISGDPITGSYKCQDAEAFQSRAKWIIATNSIMDIKDVSYGFLRRMVVIPFNAKFKDSSEPQGRGRPVNDKIDYDLLDKLRAELPEIYWWAFYGYWLLKHGHKFEKTADQLMWDLKLRETIDSAYLFSTEGLEDFIRRNSQTGSLTDDREVFKWYANWCKESCNEVAPRYQSIDRIIDAVDDSIPELRVTKLRIEGESAVRKYFIFPDIEIRDWEKFDAPSQEKLRRMGCRLITLEDEERQWLEDARRREEAAEARRKAREAQEQEQAQEQ
ncbi:MAG: toprim domain-containing protein, partial [Synergistaceae bacterium]|nr:toprim domain-containing protein [Synergistaceae bacterium]